MGSNFKAELFIAAVDGVHGPLVAHHPEEVIVRTLVSLIRDPQGQVKVGVTPLLRSISQTNVNDKCIEKLDPFSYIQNGLAF